jgi:hypothetical protein
MKYAFTTILVSLLVALAACGSTPKTTVSQPITVDLGKYETCAIDFDARDLKEGQRGGAAFAAYLEGRLREEGVLEPVEPGKTADADVTLRVRPVPEKDAAAAVTMAVEVIATKSSETLGVFEATGKQEDPGGGIAAGPRGVALQRAADEIASFLKTKRTQKARAAVRAKPAPAPPPPPPTNPADDPFAPRPPNVPLPPICASECECPASSALPPAELTKLTQRIDPTLKFLRACLGNVGAHLVEPAVLFRFGDDGRLVGMRIDMGGYEEQLLCVDDIRAAPPRVRTFRSAMVRCRWHCVQPTRPPEQPDR